MNEAFELLDPRNAQALLKSFDSDARRKGEALFRGGKVQELGDRKPGTSYFAAVQDGGTRTVNIVYEPSEGWGGVCSCDRQFDCEHLFAAMRALLAEHSTAAVRNLSSGTSSASLASRKDEDGGGLARRLILA